jgi:DNA-directed RNA polymerase II subunit RPB1
MQVLIRQGELLCGGLCKKALGGAGGGLVHVIWAEHGPDAARLFLNNCQYTVNHWLLHYGMSIGIADTAADLATLNTINEIIGKVGGCLLPLIISSHCVCECKVPSTHHPCTAPPALPQRY